MKKSSVVLCAVMFAAISFIAMPADAGMCRACDRENPYFSVCSAANGEWVNCYQICDDWQTACSCQQQTWAGACELRSDGTYGFIKYRDVLLLSPDVDFFDGYEVIKVKVVVRGVERG